MSVPYADNPGGQLSVVVNDLQYASDVYLLDQNNFERYQRGESFDYFGGNYNQSPVKITVTGPGSWYLIVDDGGSGSRYSYEWL